MADFGEHTKGQQNDEWDGATLEQELRSVLRPLAVPEGFAARVIARVQEVEVPLRPVQSPSTSKPIVRWAIAAVLLLTISFGGYEQRQRERRIAGERARQQVLLALQITSSTLQAVRTKVDSDHSN